LKEKEEAKKVLNDEELQYLTARHKDIVGVKANPAVARVPKSASKKDESTEDELDEDGSGSSEEDESKDPAPQIAQAKPKSNTTRLVGREELLTLLTELAMDALPLANRENGERATIGMVGYPNVGKSSTINVLMGCKKVSVAATPGHTKHFQTLNLNDEVALMDCPGLVFPTFLNSKADLVTNGIYPIDQLREFMTPVQQVCERISRSQFRLAYSLDFPGDHVLSANDLLEAHARMMGFSKGFGQVDVSKSARIILKDMCAGKLLYCHPPPGLLARQRDRFYSSFTVDNIMTSSATSISSGTGPVPAARVKPTKERFDNFLKNPHMEHQGGSAATAISSQGDSSILTSTDVKDGPASGKVPLAQAMAAISLSSSGSVNGAIEGSISVPASEPIKQPEENEDDFSDSDDSDDDDDDSEVDQKDTSLQPLQEAQAPQQTTYSDGDPARASNIGLIAIPEIKTRMIHVKLEGQDDGMLENFVGAPSNKRLTRKQERLLNKQRRAEGKGLLRKARRRPEKDQEVVKGYATGPFAGINFSHLKRPELR
jgi:ribosome biogenesis GTPase A